MRACLLLLCLMMGAPLGAFTFDSIDGGQIDSADWAGRPVLVVNTASRCGFTPQYEGLQALQDRYGPQGLVVLAVPSDDFNQELATEAEVKDYCETVFGLTLPMTTITPVLGPAAHPFYQWLAESADFVPGWNFNKVLLDPKGRVVATYGARTRPLSTRLTRQIEALLPDQAVSRP